MITREAIKTAIGQSKGIDGASLSDLWREAEDRTCHAESVSVVLP